MVHHHGYFHLHAHTHHTCHDASLSCCIQLHKFEWFGRPFWTHAYVHLLRHSQKKERLDLHCCIAARAKPMGRQHQTARMKLMFVRWFGRPFWTHADVHLLVYTHCSSDGSAVHFWTHADVHPQISGTHSKTKLDLCCCIAARAMPMGRQYQTARMKLVFIISCSSINSRQHVAQLSRNRTLL
jgi:hypothetical protein